jgi:hypothetical protein
VTIAEVTDEGDFSGKVFKFKNPGLESGLDKKQVKAVILYGTKYRPLKWLSDPRDAKMWTDNEFTEILKVTQGQGFRVETLRDDLGHFIEEKQVRHWQPDEWIVELDNGASFLNMRQGRDFPRPSAALLSLAWLGQAYEAEFWFWEMIEFSRKLVLSAVGQFDSSDYKNGFSLFLTPPLTPLLVLDQSYLCLPAARCRFCAPFSSV